MFSPGARPTTTCNTRSDTCTYQCFNDGANFILGVLMILSRKFVDYNFCTQECKIGSVRSIVFISILPCKLPILYCGNLSYEVAASARQKTFWCFRKKMSIG